MARLRPPFLPNMKMNADGSVTLNFGKGDSQWLHKTSKLSQLASTLVDFELGFEILPSTKSSVQPKVAKKGPYKQDLRKIDP